MTQATARDAEVQPRRDAGGHLRRGEPVEDRGPRGWVTGSVARAASLLLSGRQRTVRSNHRVGMVSLATTGAALSARAAWDVARPTADSSVQANVLGYQVVAPTWWDLMYLYGGVFLGGEYHFDTDCQRPFIVDCGANIGMATLYFKRLYPDCSVLAFEPNPAIADMFEWNISTNELSDVELVRAALGNSCDSYVDLFLDPRLRGGLTSTTESASAGSTVQRVSNRQLSGHLDRHVDLLKLDVEGAEHAVLADLLESGKIDLVRRMAIEYHHHLTPDDDRLGQLLSLLEAADFGYHVSTRTRPPGRGQYQDVSLDVYRKGAGDGGAPRRYGGG